MKTSFGTPPCAYADPIISSGLTLKNRPNTSFIAMKAVAMPADDARKRRRLTPRCLAASPASSATRASTCFCCSVCGIGKYSPFDTTCVGIGEPSVSASSARTRRASCDSDSQESSSREPGRRFDMALLLWRRAYAFPITGDRPHFSCLNNYDPDPELLPVALDARLQRAEQHVDHHADDADRDHAAHHDGGA